MSGVSRAAATGGCGRAERLVHDLADGAGAAAALCAATEAAIDLSGRARTRLRRDGGADIVVGQDVAGADDHGRRSRAGSIDTGPPDRGQKKIADFIRCLNCQTAGFAGLSTVLPPPTRRPASVPECAGVFHRRQAATSVSASTMSSTTSSTSSLVVALAHHPDHRLGAGRADHQPALAVELLLGALDGEPDLGVLQRLARLVAHVAAGSAAAARTGGRPPTPACPASSPPPAPEARRRGRRRWWRSPTG